MAIFRFLKRRFFAFRREAVILLYAFGNKKTPFGLKIASLVTALYLLSPIDLIPITVPFFGVLDDIILVPLAVSWIAKKLPADVYLHAGHRADYWIARWLKRPLIALLVFAVILLGIWVLVLYLMYKLLLG